MRKVLFTLAIISALSFGGIALAQQPDIDTVDIDVDKCTVIVEFNDGRQDTQSIEIFVNDIRTHNIIFNDVVGDQSATVATFKAVEGDEILVRLTTSGEDEYEVTLVVGSCPTPTPTNTPTNTPTSTPTTIPTNTPVPPTQTPVVIVIERLIVAPTSVPTAVPVQALVVRPPSTGDAGLR